METQEKIKKVDVSYLLINIFAPILALVLITVLSVEFLIPEVGAILIMGGLVLAILWWTIFSKKLYEKGAEKKLADLEEQGFCRNHTFTSDGCTLAVDLRAGKVALLFRWNPKKLYVFPGSRISKAWVNDGKGGVGILEGSSRVSFLFTVDGTTIRINTFTSNKRWRMDSEYILTGISKADVMVEALQAAGAGVESR